MNNQKLKHILSVISKIQRNKINKPFFNVSPKRFHIASHPYLLIQNQVKKQDHGSLSAQSGCTTLNLYCLQQRLLFPLHLSYFPLSTTLLPLSPFPFYLFFFASLSRPSHLLPVPPSPSPVRGSFSRSFYLSFRPHPLRPF